MTREAKRHKFVHWSGTTQEIDHDDLVRICDVFNVPPHIVTDEPRKRTWRLRRWLRRLRH